MQQMTGLQKQNVNINFAKGLDTKTDPYQTAMDNFLALQNMVFNKGGLLTKRNGFPNLTALPNNTYTYLTTFNTDLTAIGENIAAYSTSLDEWVTKGTIAPLSLNVLPLIRNSTNQSQCDAIIAPNGLICTVYTDQNPANLALPLYKYVIADSVTGQNIIEPTIITVTAGTVGSAPKVYYLGNYFMIIFINSLGGIDHLNYIAVSSLNPTVATPNTDISDSISGPSSATQVAFEGYVVSNKLMLAWNSVDVGGSVRMTSLTAGLYQANTIVFVGSVATSITVTADTTTTTPTGTPYVYVSFFNNASNTGYTAATDTNLNVQFAPTLILTGGTVNNLASCAQGGICTIFVEYNNNYSYNDVYGNPIPTHYISQVTISSAASVTAPYVVIRSVGLASKAFILGGVEYFLSSYQSVYQSTYFLINGSISTEASPVVVSKLASGNGGGYLNFGLPNITIVDDSISIPYLYADLVQAVNKGTNLTPDTQVDGIYSQLGINLCTFTFGTEFLDTAEIASTLNISGGFGWMYDGYLPVENNFFLWPDSITAVPSTTGGNLSAQTYFYQVTYEWADNQGNVHRSAPSIPVETTTTAGSPITFMGTIVQGSQQMTVNSVTGLVVGQIITDTTNPTYIQGGTTITTINPVTLVVGISLPAEGSSSMDNMQTLNTASVTLNIPYLRLTYKVENPVKIVVYRWSTAQQIYYQVTSIELPTLNNTSLDSIAYVDTAADAVILGNNIIYTNGGVVEDFNAPANDITVLFDDRLWILNSEDRNQLWFSKQVIENTPVEMSAYLTYYVAPTIGAEGSTGPITAGGVLDDKLIVFKENAIYYINGTGPDNTGANNQYSQPIFVTSTVGCANQRSIVFIPQGLMFQSNKGIWLLGRDMSTSYIGAPVEEFNSSIVKSAINIPETNQVRFTLDTGQVLMYDYFYQQWGTFVNIPGISSTIYNELHTYINQYGQVFQESPGTYLDGSTPVTISFTTAWFKFAGLQGFQRAYFFYLLGTYYSPHTLTMNIAYNYNPGIVQQTTVYPVNYSEVYGADPLYGSSSPYGGANDVEKWRIFLDLGKCESFQISLAENYNPLLGEAAGEGLSLSGINLVYGYKKGFRTQMPSLSTG